MTGPAPARRDWFCEEILAGKLAVTVLYEDDRVLGVVHPDPEHRVHGVVYGVVLPKAHVASILAAEALDGDLLVAMVRAVQAVAQALGLDKKGFRLEVNVGPASAPHMHWHVIGPGSLRTRRDRPFTTTRARLDELS